MAGFLNYGSSRGLAVAHNWGNDMQTLFQDEALRAKSQADQEQKTAFYAKQLQEGQATSPYNTARLQDFYSQKNKEVADFVIKNPNFETDVQKMTEFMGITDKYLNNDIIREDQQVQGQFNSLTKAIGSHELTTDEATKEMEKYNAYRNADPKSGTKPDPYIFSNPLRPDFEKLIKEATDNIGYDSYTRMGKDGREYNITEPKSGVRGVSVNWDNKAIEKLGDPQFKLSAENYYNKNPELQKIYPNVIKFVADKMSTAMNSKDVLDNNGVPKTGFEGMYSHLDNEVGAALRQNPNAKTGEMTTVLKNTPALAYLTNANKPGGDIPVGQGGTKFLLPTTDANGKETVSESFNINFPMKHLSSSDLVTIGGKNFVKSNVVVMVPKPNDKITDDKGNQVYMTSDGSVVTQAEYMEKYIKDHPEVVGKNGVANNDILTKAWNDFTISESIKTASESKRLENAGFKPQSGNESGLANFQMSDTRFASTSYVREVLQPMGMSDSQAFNYEKVYAGGDEKMRAFGQSLTNTAMMNRYRDNPRMMSELIDAKTNIKNDSGWSKSTENPDLYYSYTGEKASGKQLLNTFDATTGQTTSKYVTGNKR
jgi:hypothetical protein